MYLMLKMWVVRQTDVTLPALISLGALTPMKSDRARIRTKQHEK